MSMLWPHFLAGLAAFRSPDQEAEVMDGTENDWHRFLSPVQSNDCLIKPAASFSEYLGHMLKSTLQ